MRRRIRMLAVLAAGLAAVVTGVTAQATTGTPAGTAAGTAAAARATAACAPVTWGSLPETGAAAPVPGPPVPASTVRNVRTGRNDCYDRLVVDLSSTAPAYDVRYVDRVTEDGSGRVVPLRGGARLQLVVRAPAHDLAGRPTYVPANPAELAGVTGYRTFRQVAWAGSFEGSTTLGLGVRARLPFRVLRLAGPGAGSRVVVDVAHTW